jgi:hypothetical protein
LLTVSGFSINVFAQNLEVKIVASVNNDVVTSFDVKNTHEVLLLLVPEMNKIDIQQQRIVAVQHLVGNILKKEYIKRASLEISQEDIKTQAIKFKEDLKSKKIKDIKSFMDRYHSFVEEEVFWNAVVFKYIMPNIQVSDVAIERFTAQNPKVTKEEAKSFITQQQVESQTKQIIDSIKQTSVVEIDEEYFMQ